MKALSLLVLALAACGGDDGGTQTFMDAPSGNMNKVQTVTCPSAVDATVMTNSAGDAYVPPATTVPVNAVVKFVMPSTHNVAPNTATTTDPGLAVDFGQTKCLKFTQAGTFGFFCSVHGFHGTVTVQ